MRLSLPFDPLFLYFMNLWMVFDVTYLQLPQDTGVLERVDEWCRVFRDVA